MGLLYYCALLGIALLAESCLLSIQLGHSWTCVDNVNGSHICWGLPDKKNPVELPIENFKYINPGMGAIGASPSCGLLHSGEVRCWGRDIRQLKPVPDPVGIYHSLSVGSSHACALDEANNPKCWSYSLAGGLGDQDVVPVLLVGKKFIQIVAGEEQTCAIEQKWLELSCWGVGSEDIPITVPQHVLQSKVLHVSAGWKHVCAVLDDGMGDGAGQIACWGWDGYGQSSPPSGRYRSVECGFDHTCAMTLDTMIECWGRDADGQSTPPVKEKLCAKPPPPTPPPPPETPAPPFSGYLLNYSNAPTLRTTLSLMCAVVLAVSLLTA